MRAHRGAKQTIGGSAVTTSPESAPVALEPAEADDAEPDARRAIAVEASLQLRAPWAASVAGLLFAILFTVAVVLLRGQPSIGATTAESIVIYASGQDFPAMIAGLYVMPFAGIMFLWFIAVVRDQVGDREDRFFATGFLGSGLIWVGVLFAAIAIATSPSVAVRYLGQGPPTGGEIELLAAVTYTLMFVYGTRAAAVFLITMSTLGMRSQAFPVWLARAGYVVGVLMFLVVAFYDWIILVFPAWIALVSVFILRRERARRHQAEAHRAA
jgi:hypothetical protein